MKGRLYGGLTLEEGDERFGCIDCVPKRIGELYMLRDDLWYEMLRLGLQDNLCLEHLETRLGRLLVADDFLAYDGPIIRGVPISIDEWRRWNR